MLRRPGRGKPTKRRPQVDCAFCFQQLPKPAPVDAFAPEGALGGRCQCGVWFVVDATGKLGGQALLDLTTLACEGDVGRALKLESGVDYELRTKSLSGRDRGGRGSRRPVPGVATAWFLELKSPPP